MCISPRPIIYGEFVGKTVQKYNTATLAWMEVNEWNALKIIFHCEYEKFQKFFYSSATIDIVVVLSV